MNNNNFLHDSFLLILVNLMLMFIDFYYNVFLSKLIGAEGIGLSQMAMSILMILLVISSGGIPTAVSKLIAEQNSKNNNYAVKKTFKLALLFTLILSIILSLILILYSKAIAINIFKNENMLILIYLLIPATIITSVSSVFRGYYYGLKMIIVPSISHIIENITRFLIVIGFLYYLSPFKPIHGAMIAISGIILGEIFDLTWLIIMQKPINKNMTYIIKTKIHRVSIIKQILYIAIPIGISNLSNILLRFLNTILIPQKLISVGYTNSEAISTFGRITGMAMPLITIPFIVTSAVVINLIPNLSGDIALKDYRTIKKQILISIKITLLVSIPLTGIYAFFSKPIALFLYNDAEVAKFIYIMGYNTIFLALQHTFFGILHSFNKQIIVTINRLIGMALQLLAIYFFMGNPNYGINGFFIGFFLSGMVVCILDFIVLKRIMRLNIKYLDLVLKPLIATGFMVTSIYAFLMFIANFYINHALIFISSLTIGLLSYIFILYITKAIPKNLLKRS